jgi:hypothetical protein
VKASLASTTLLVGLPFSIQYTLPAIRFAKDSLLLSNGDKCIQEKSKTEGPDAILALVLDRG